MKYNITYSDAQRYVWFRNAKCATRTTIKFLYENSDIKSGFPLNTGKDVGHGREYKQNWDEYFRFTIVRNPWDRLLSFYQNKLHNIQIEDTEFSIFKGCIDFKKFVYAIKERDLERCDGHFKLQSQMFPLDKIDFIGRFENLQGDFNTVCDKIGIPQQQLPHENKTKHKHYTEYYDDETRQIVAEKYAKDIEYFGYKFGE